MTRRLLLIFALLTTVVYSAENRINWKPDIFHSLFDLRTQFLEGSEISDVYSYRVIVDDGGLLRPRGRMILKPFSDMRNFVSKMYSEQGRTIQTTHFLIVVKKESITTYKFRKFEDIPETIPLQPGDLVLFAEKS